MVKAVRQYWILLLVPGIVLGCSVLLRSAAGPFWLSANYDPAYQYLLNGLRLLKSLVPNHIDHPGTPLQMLCAAVCWLFNAGRSIHDLALCVFKSPEFYLHASFVVLAGLSFLTSVFLAGYVFLRTKDILAAVLTQLPALCFLVLRSWDTGEPVLPVAANVFPETLLIAIVNLFNFCLFQRLFIKTSKGAYAATVLWGFVCGMGVAVKITFVPLLAVPMIILSWRNRAVLLISCILSFVVWTLPIVSIYPALGKWFYSILTHTGSLGGGNAGIIEARQYWENWKNIICEQVGLAWLLLLAGGLCFWKLAIKKWEWQTSCLASVIMSVVLQWAVVAKNPGEHYLLPGMGLFSAVLAIAYLQGPFQKPLGQRIVLVFVAASVLAGLWQALEYRQKLEGLTKDIKGFYDHVQEQYKGFNVVGFYRSSGQAGALAFGDMASGSWDELRQAYPDSFDFNRWTYRIRDIRGSRVFSNDLMATYPGVIFLGDGDYDFSPTAYSVHLLEKGRMESVFLLTNTTEKQAFMLHLAANYYDQKGDHLKAVECNARASALHYALP